MLKLLKGFERKLDPKWGSIQMAYAKIDEQAGTVRALHNETSCKDYITDSLVYIDEEVEPTGVWRFRGPIETEHTVLLINALKDFKKNISEFQKWEESHGIKPLEWFETDHSDVVAIKADAWWMKTTVHLSLLLSWLRNLSSDSCEGDLRKCTGDVYIYAVYDKALDLPRLLQQLQVTRKRNAPTRDVMHTLNGHYTLLTNDHIRQTLYYGPQLMAIDPQFFLKKETA